MFTDNGLMDRILKKINKPKRVLCLACSNGKHQYCGRQIPDKDLRLNCDCVCQVTERRES